MKVIDLERHQLSEEFHKWVAEELKPAYIDPNESLNEHLYPADPFDDWDDFASCPDSVTKEVNQIKELARKKGAAYFRIVIN